MRLRTFAARLMSPLVTVSLVASAALAVVVTAPGLASPLPASETTTPERVLRWLYIDLAGLHEPKLSQPPLWQRHLSRRTQALLEGFDAMDARRDHPTFDYDWLCQCRHRRRLRVPPSLVVDESSSTAAAISVRMRFYGGEVQTVHVLMVHENGWKIDDIIDESGFRFTGEMKRAIEGRPGGRLRLLRQLP